MRRMMFVVMEVERNDRTESRPVAVFGDEGSAEDCADELENWDHHNGRKLRPRYKYVVHKVDRYYVRRGDGPLRPSRLLLQELRKDG